MLEYKNLSIIVAMTEERVIGNKGLLPWHIPEDLKNFKRLTTNNTVLMGRNTYESIGKPLPNRINIVLSSSMQSQEGILIARTLEEALVLAEKQNHDKQNKEVFVIGGANLYKQTIARTATLYISLIKQNYEGDIFFPEFNESDFEITEMKKYPDFTFKKYERK